MRKRHCPNDGAAAAAAGKSSCLVSTQTESPDGLFVCLRESRRSTSATPAESPFSSQERSRLLGCLSAAARLLLRAGGPRRARPRDRRAAAASRSRRRAAAPPCSGGQLPSPGPLGPRASPLSSARGTGRRRRERLLPRARRRPTVVPPRTVRSSTGARRGEQPRCSHTHGRRAARSTASRLERLRRRRRDRPPGGRRAALSCARPH